nr:hypothetical protein [uncultured bacterium]
MSDEIKRTVVKDDALHFVRGADVWSVKAEEGKEPNEWKVVHFANVGTSEEFIETFSGEILELVDGSLIFDEEREAVKNAIMTIVVEGLMPAFEHLKKIRASIITPLPELNRRQLYEDFARSLWHAYKDLFPKAALLLGFDIGFLFRQEPQFENGVTAFLNKFPSLILDVPELLRRQRANWQQRLSSFRNDYLEHRKKDIAEFADYYQPATAEMLFDHAWRTMAELFPAFIESRYPPTWSITEIPINERDPKHWRRWRFFQCEPAERGSFEVKVSPKGDG